MAEAIVKFFLRHGLVFFRQFIIGTEVRLEQPSPSPSVTFVLDDKLSEEYQTMTQDGRGHRQILPASWFGILQTIYHRGQTSRWVKGKVVLSHFSSLALLLSHSFSLCSPQCLD
jgi:hypothetical protein